jgi:energy-coupling factor transport system substrate-specific component
MNIYRNGSVKFVVGFFICLLVRLIPFRPPNIEPILSTQMPFSKAYGPLAGFVFAFMSIVLYDLVTNTLGVWSLLTASAYGVLGLLGAFYFRNRVPSAFNFVRFAIFGTLFFDAATGLTIGPLFFNQPFLAALIGQIPFTAWHLVGNISFAIILSPAIYRLIIQNQKLAVVNLINIFKSKKI